MPYRIDIPDPPHEVIERLTRLGALDVSSTADGVGAILSDAVSPDILAVVLGDTSFVVSSAHGRDADSVWLLAPRLLRVGGLTIAPVGTDAPADAVRLEDSEAFGTGHHPTTRLCLEALEQEVRAACPDAVLDVGIGSGVLALAALRLGVPVVTGVDIDPAALAVATRNAAHNGFEHRLRLLGGGPEVVQGQWPLVLANVLAAPLMEMAPMLARRLGHRGRVILSGIPQGVSDDVVRVYRNRGLHLVTHNTAEGWTALVLQASW